jgi:hypothetical protein
MSLDDNQETVRVSFDDLSTVASPSVVEPSQTVADVPIGTKSYGNINETAETPTVEQEKSSVLLQAWFYLGLAGMIGAVVGWAICEPAFVDGGGRRWGNIWMLPILVALICIGFAVAESVVERSMRKAFQRAGLGLVLGIVLGFLFENIADVIFTLLLSIFHAAGMQTNHNPSFWIARGLAWIAFGAAGGVVYGIVGQSMKKTGYGVLGGAAGAFLGGVIFDPISFATHGGAASRAVGFCLLGLFTGIAMGLVESALKDRWLYVTSGPLAGKQFILYKPLTTIGSSQACDIYLFKDADILPQHATLEVKGSRTHLLAAGTVYAAGQPVRGMRVLESGSVISLGRYGFRYQEKQRS